MSVARAHRRVLRTALWVCAASFAFGMLVLPPLYRIACERIFGIRLDGSPVTVAVQGAIDASREVVVEFDTSVNSKLPWSFRAASHRMRVRPGEVHEALFYARNDAERPIVGQAVPSVAPSTASIYFNKTECFCFTEQLLAPGEERAMPVRFVVDPQLPAGVRTLTLSYTFYNNDIATARLAAGAR